MKKLLIAFLALTVCLLSMDAQTNSKVSEKEKTKNTVDKNDNPTNSKTGGIKPEKGPSTKTGGIKPEKGPTGKTGGIKPEKGKESKFKPNYGQTPDEKARVQTNRLKTALTLNARQEAQVYSVLLDTEKELEKIKNSLRPEQSKEGAIAMVKSNRDKAMGKILDTKQMAKYEQIMMSKDRKANPDMKANRKLSMLDQVVQLSSEQKPKALAIYKEYSQRMDKVLSSINPDTPMTDKLKGSIEKIKSDERNAIKAILTPSQVKKFESRDKRDKRSKADRDGAKVKPNKLGTMQREQPALVLTNTMKDKLGLTDSQVKLVRNINDKAQKQIDDINAADLDSKTRASRLKDAEESRYKAVEAVLNSDQKKQFKKMKSERKKSLKVKAKNSNPKSESKSSSKPKVKAQSKSIDK